MDALSGKKKDDPLLADPIVKALAGRSFDLVACRAIATDSDAPCALVPIQKDDCRLLRATFHELRTNPSGRTYMFPDISYEMCRADAKGKPYCDRLRDALRSGKADDCANAGEFEGYCRAAITLDESYCEKSKESNGCKKVIDANRELAKGLKALADSGPRREQGFAKAALGDPEACTPFAQEVMTSCASEPPVSNASPASKSSPAANSTARPAASRRESAR